MSAVLRAALLLLLLQGGCAHATTLFDSDALLDVELSGPFHSLIGERTRRLELPFSLSANGVEHAVTLRVRGKSRLRVCDFPPLRIEFPADVAASSVFSGQRNLKLVTHCSAGRRARVDTLEEYTAYRLFNLLSDVGFRVRLLQISYEDTDGELDFEPGGHFGFLIEPVGELASRVGGEPVELDGVRLSSLNNRQAALVYVFQYLIGNTDWSLATALEDDACCHNGDLLTIGGELYYLPYDFDLAGLVNTSYARPDPSLRISRVTRRLYRGYCIDREYLEQALEDVRTKEDEIQDVVEQLPDLSRKERQRVSRFLEGFFKRADDPARLIRVFEKTCL